MHYVLEDMYTVCIYFNNQSINQSMCYCIHPHKYMDMATGHNNMRQNNTYINTQSDRLIQITVHMGQENKVT
jgi:hypothetical protein